MNVSTVSTIGKPARRSLAGRLVPTRKWLLGGVLRALPGAAFCLILVIAWQVMAHRLHSPLIPDVFQIWTELQIIVGDGEAFKQISITLERIAGGFVAGFAVAIVLGILAARHRIVEAFFEPAMILGLTVPGLVWALLCVIWFGVGPATSVVAIALGIAPALTVNVVQGIRSIDAELVEMAHVYRFSSVARWRYLWMPAISPYLVGCTRLGFSLAWKVIVLVEIFGLSDGVGYQLNAAFSATNVAGVLAWTVVFGLAMAVIEYGVLQHLERWLVRWRRQSRV
jgi:NitT/TauT family transport system permease protein